MVDLLAWETDVVVGGDDGGRSDDENDANFNPSYLHSRATRLRPRARSKSASLYRSIQDLRLRLPPSDIPQRLPDIHAHLLASNNAPALQLNAQQEHKQDYKMAIRKYRKALKYMYL